MPIYDAPGSPPGKLSPFDWQSILWTLFTAAIAAVLTALVDSVLPDLKDRGLIDAALFTLLTTLLHAARKFFLDTRVIAVLVAVSLLAIGGTATAGEVAVVIDDAKAGTYLVTVGTDGTVAVNPIRVVRPGLPPVGPPPDQPPTTFEAEVERQTKAVLTAGGSPTTGAALSSVYSLVADEVAAGRLAPGSALPAVKAATDLVMSKQADAAAWASWRTTIGDALTILSQQGKLGTKEQVAAALRQVSGGLKRASGLNMTVAEVLKLQPDMLGILDGIDFAQLIELIKLIMELLKLFGGLP